MNNNCDCEAKSPCCKEPAFKELKVLVTIKKEFWVEDIKRYVIPRMYFVCNNDINDKPFVCETKNIEFRIDNIYATRDVFIFDAFESVTISTL